MSRCFLYLFFFLLLFIYLCVITTHAAKIVGRFFSFFSPLVSAFLASRMAIRRKKEGERERRRDLCGKKLEGVMTGMDLYL